MQRINKGLYLGLVRDDLTVIDVVRREDKKQSEVKCLCSCGNVCYFMPSQFRRGLYHSCGCKRTDFKKVHGGSSHPLYQEWRSIVSRCTDPNSYNYKDYGARGITVCDEWLNNPFAFYDWVEAQGGRPEHSTLDRIDNDKGYSPDNVKFVSMHDQARNKRSNIMISHNGETKCLTDWALQYGVHNETARGRYKRGLTFEEIFSKGHLPNSGQFKKKRAT